MHSWVLKVRNMRMVQRSRSRNACTFFSDEAKTILRFVFPRYAQTDSPSDQAALPWPSPQDADGVCQKLAKRVEARVRPKRNKLTTNTLRFWRTWLCACFIRRVVVAFNSFLVTAARGTCRHFVRGLLSGDGLEWIAICFRYLGVYNGVKAVAESPTRKFLHHSFASRR